MRQHGRLQLAIGFASSAGRSPDNQDFGAVDLGDAREAELQGVVAAIADGSGGGAGGRIAAELAVRTFLDGYRSQSELAGIGAAAMTTLEPFNLWLHAQAQTAPSLRGAATTFTAAVLRGRNATILHVGDSRAWRLRSDALALLTDDHVALQVDGGQRLLRALGLEPSLRLDVHAQVIEAHDRILLSTDGVHAVLSSSALTRLLGRRQAAQADAEALVAAALEAGGHDNATAIVIDVIEVPAADYSLIVAQMGALPVAPDPRVGDTVDGFELIRVIAESEIARLFLAKDGRDLVVLKFPKFERGTDDDRRRFMREVFLGQRIAHPCVGASLALADGRQSRLYVAMPHYLGETLEARLRRRPMDVEEAICVACKVGRGLAALHRAGVAHRDLKPQNVMLLEDGGVKIIDLGVARLPGLEDLDETETPGTADFMAPELYESARGDALSDQYALGVTLYRMLTGAYPHGDRPLFGPVPPLTRYRSEIPAWLNAAVLRAISPRRDERFGDVDELVFELEHGKTRAAPLAPPKPLLERNPVLFWRLLCLVLAILLAVSVLRR
jgi:serine/threonine protein phosphatase PrpC